MTEASPNWKEHEGEVLPSYTGPNAPVYSNDSQAENLRQLEETHPEFPVTDTETGTQTPADTKGIDAEEVDVEQIRADLRKRLPRVPHDPYNPYKGATRRYLNNRKDILG